MVAINDENFVFVHKKRGPGDKLDSYERRKIDVAQEGFDQVVVASGLRAGEEVVTNGSLILAQLYEDRRVISTGLPSQ